MISKEDQKNLPEDENTPEKRTEKIWNFFGKKEKGRRMVFFWSCVWSRIHKYVIQKKKKTSLIRSPKQTKLKSILILFSLQIKLQKESSSREWWRIRTSSDWSSLMSLRRFKTDSNKRSNSACSTVFRFSDFVWLFFLFHDFLFCCIFCPLFMPLAFFD